MNNNDMERKNRIAQWAFDTRPILGRFHLWLEDVDVEWVKEGIDRDINHSISFVDEQMEKLFAMTAAVTALGTKLFGRYGEGKGAEKKELNQVKKDADAISAYAMSESLWYLSRSLPENHAIMVCLGEGLMPKAGETQEMGSNPMLGFGRIYARPQVAKFLDGCIQKLINDNKYNWEEFNHDLKDKGLTIWGAAIDTLENTSRFAKGSETGPMTVLHVFDQPLSITKPYEGYIGNLILPKFIVDAAAEKSLLIDFFTPRVKVMDAIKLALPEIKNENVHVWTLTGKGRDPRIGKLWKEWKEIGVHLVEPDWELPNGNKVFTESGTYAPTFHVKTWKDDKNEIHLFLIDGYAASAEAIQAASLSPILGLDTSLAVLSSKFKLSYDLESQIMRLNPDADDFADKLSEKFGKKLDAELIEQYRESIKLAGEAGIPLDKRIISIDDFLPEKKWRVMAVSGYMLPDPYTDTPGIEKIYFDSYKVIVRLSTQLGEKKITFKLKLTETFKESQLVFNPLLNRFMHGEDFHERAVKISDSGRIRNELQTLCSEAIEHFENDGIKIHFNQISKDVILPENQTILREILDWYKENHPIWFNWLEQD